MQSRLQFTLVERHDRTTCYVWRVLAHGKGTRRQIVTCVDIPPEDRMSPAAVLRALADQLDKPILERWHPA